MDPSLFPALLSLVTVARSGSVGAAARLRHRTSSAISQQMRRLEAHFGTRFLERHGRGVRLTPAGEAVLPAVLRLCDEAEALFGQLGELAGRRVTTLRVAVSDYLGRALLAPVLRDLVERQEPLRFEIATTHSREGLRLVERGEVEFALVSTAAPDGGRGLDEERLFVQPFLWVGPRRGGRRPPPLVERLGREPLLRLGADSQGRRLLEAYLEREGIRPASTIDVPSVSLLLAYVSAGLGVGLAPALALADGRAGAPPGGLVAERARVPDLPVVLVSRPGARRDPLAARFAAGLIAEGARARERLARWQAPPRRQPARRAR
jgi:DNA-binding transcriptional LysR family regulator